MKTCILRPLFTIMMILGMTQLHAMKPSKSFDELDSLKKAAALNQLTTKPTFKEIEPKKPELPQQNNAGVSNNMLNVWNNINPDVKFAGKQMFVGATVFSLVQFLGFLRLKFTVSDMASTLDLNTRIKINKSVTYAINALLIFDIVYPLYDCYQHTKKTCQYEEFWPKLGAFVKNACIGYLSNLSGMVIINESWLGTYINTKLFEQRLQLNIKEQQLISNIYKIVEERSKANMNRAKFDTD